MFCCTVIQPNFDCACAVWYPDNNKKYTVFAISFIWRTSQARNAIGNTSAKLYCKPEFLHNSCGGWKVFYNYLINILKNVCDRIFLSFVLAWPMVKKLSQQVLMFNRKHFASHTAILACQLLCDSQKRAMSTKDFFSGRKRNRTISLIFF